MLSPRAMDGLQKTEGASRAGAKTNTQKQAIARAVIKMTRDHVEVIIHGEGWQDPQQR
jgi:molybdenum cofactor biosynthesis enzyme